MFVVGLPQDDSGDQSSISSISDEGSACERSACERSVCERSVCEKSVDKRATLSNDHSSAQVIIDPS